MESHTSVEDLDLVAFLLAKHTYPLVDTRREGHRIAFVFSATPTQIDALARDFDAGAALPARDVLSAFRTVRKSVSRALGVRR